MNPEGLLSPGVTNFAITPAMNPMMIVQMMCMANFHEGLAQPISARTIFAIAAFNCSTWMNQSRRLGLRPGSRVHLPVVRYDAKASERSLDLLRWGLVPYWAKDIKVGFANINAKAEGIESKPAFRDAFQRRRCLVPVDNFYEWKKTATGKQPYAISLADGGIMALAGLWENWRSSEGEWVRSFAIITTTPNELCAELHDRMPVVLAPETW